MREPERLYGRCGGMKYEEIRFYFITDFPHSEHLVREQFNLVRTGDKDRQLIRQKLAESGTEATDMREQ